eukprot:439352_1
MGFEEQVSLECAYKFEGDLQKCIEFILKVDNKQNTEHSDNNNHLKIARTPQEYKQEISITTSQNNKSSVLDQEMIRFVDIMTRYTKSPNKPFMQSTNILNVLNDYIFLIHKYNDDQNFEIIANELGQCDLKTCNMFMRYCRDKTKDESFSNMHESVCYELLDKMHCYFHHSYDTGSRLSNTEKQSIIDVVNERKHENDDAFDQVLFNRKLKSIKHVIESKQQKNKQIYSKFNDHSKMFCKYNQLYLNDEKQQSNDNIFSVGYEFYYGYDGEQHMPSLIGWPTPDPIKVIQKYQTLKEEFIQNPFSRLNIKQYENEHSKATINFQSQFFKSNECFQSYERQYEINYMLKSIKWEFKMEYLLAMMVYCNYTDLQYHFSKTYRENRGSAHQNFYFWGKSLKIYLHQFGTKPLENGIDCFYHGLNRKLLFPQYLNFDCLNGISIWCPLSTSESFPVAVTFADTNGLIIEFTDVYKLGGYSQPYAKCISASWLSDYAAEKEYLFVQDTQTIMINDIIDVNNSIQYKTLLQAMTILHQFISGNFMEKYIKQLNEQMKTLLKAILDNQLSMQSPNYKTFKSLTMFGQQALSTLFEQQRTIVIHYWKLKKYANFLAKFLLSSNYEGISLGVIHTLFPNVDTIKLSNIKLCNAVFDGILAFLSKNNDNKMKLMIGSVNRNSELSVEQVIHQYSSCFRQINMFLYQDIPKRQICMVNCSKIAFIIEVMRKMNEIYFEDEDINNLMNKLLNVRINNDFMISTTGKCIDEKEQLMFDLLCDQEDCIIVSWSIFAKNRNSYLFKLLAHPNENGWMRLDLLDKLFPNLQLLLVKNGNLSTFVMDNIYEHVKNNNSNLCKILISDPNGKMSIYEAKSKYEKQFKLYKWQIEAMELNGEKNLDIQAFE